MSAAIEIKGGTSSVETINAIRVLIMDVLNSHNDQPTLVVALETIQALLKSGNTTISGCEFYGNDRVVE